MKKVLCLTAIFVSFLIVGASDTFAASVPSASPYHLPLERLALEHKLNRLQTIDKEHLTKTECKMLRKEVKSVKKRLKSYGGVYISAGALLIIVLLILLI